MRRSMRQWVAEQVSADRKKALPVLSFPSIQLMEISVKDLISSAEKQAEGMKRVADRVDSAASVSMMDLSVEAEAFGAEILFSDDEVPLVIGQLVESVEDAESLKVPDVHTGRTGLYIEAISKATELIKDRPVFAGVIGPFSLTGRLLDVSEALMSCYTDPDLIHATMKKATAFITQYAAAYKEIGANGIVLAEPLAGLLPPDKMEEFTVPYVKEIVDKVQSDDFIVIYHNCGNEVQKQAEAIFTIGAAGYHFGNVADMEYMLNKAPKDVLVLGNVDPAGQFRNGDPESIRKATKDLLEKCGKFNNFVISSGCDIPPLSPWANIDAFFDTVTEFYK